jgi:aminopeptidase YwaD
MPLNAKNVVGFIPAHDPGVKESILIGAHYDHLGTDQAGNIYFGANDNASGVSVLLELIKVFTASTWRPKVNIVFIAFSAEEVFGFGSKHYIANPLFPVEKIVAMINLDCVGSYRGEWNIATDLLRNKAKAKRVKTAFDFYHAPLKLNNSYLKRGSDHAIFYKERVPVLFLFRNSPEDLKVLHTPEDVISLISGDVLLESTELSSLLIFLLSES